MQKFLKACGFVRAYIASNGRFDLLDVADRAGLAEEVAFVKKELLALLDDEVNNIELYEFFVDEQNLAKDQLKPGLAGWVKALTGRYFA